MVAELGDKCLDFFIKLTDWGVDDIEKRRAGQKSKGCGGGWVLWELLSPINVF